MEHQGKARDLLIFVAKNLFFSPLTLALSPRWMGGDKRKKLFSLLQKSLFLSF
jgi:hypothetical protein